MDVEHCESRCSVQFETFFVTSNRQKQTLAYWYDDNSPVFRFVMYKFNSSVADKIFKQHPHGVFNKCFISTSRSTVDSDQLLYWGYLVDLSRLLASAQCRVWLSADVKELMLMTFHGWWLFTTERWSLPESCSGICSWNGLPGCQELQQEQADSATNTDQGMLANTWWNLCCV